MEEMPVDSVRVEDEEGEREAVEEAAVSSIPGVIEPQDIEGYWEAVEGDLRFTEYPGEIYFYNWYAFDVSPPSNGVTVTWDNGLNCSRTPGHLNGNELRLIANEVAVTILFHSGDHATATFEAPNAFYRKDLVKTRADPAVICN